MAFYPEIDGFTKHINQVLEPYFRVFIDYTQDNWARLLLIAKLAINNWDSVLIGISSFFLSHGYYIKPLEVTDILRVRKDTSPI
jgi:hypothetical protein